MPENLRRAHEKNDETLERIYIGRRFRNDTERLEKLFELYTKMTAPRRNPSKERKTHDRMLRTDQQQHIPSVSIATARTGTSSKVNTLGMRPMQERAYARRGEQYLLIKSPPAPASRAR